MPNIEMSWLPTRCSFSCGLNSSVLATERWTRMSFKTTTTATNVVSTQCPSRATGEYVQVTFYSCSVFLETSVRLPRGEISLLDSNHSARSMSRWLSKDRLRFEESLDRSNRASFPDQTSYLLLQNNWIESYAYSFTRASISH